MAYLDDGIEVGQLGYVIIFNGTGVRIGRGGQEPCCIKLSCDLRLDLWML